MFYKYYLGFTSEQWDSHRRRKSLLEECRGLLIPAPLPPKTFKQVHTNVPVLKNYNGDLGDAYWGKWVKRTYGSLMPVKSWISHTNLKEVARDLVYSGHKTRLLRV